MVANFVDQVMNKVGGVNLSVAPVANRSADCQGAALTGYASDCAVNAELLCTVSEAMMAGQESQNVGPSVNLGVQGPSIGWSVLGTAASIGAVAVGGGVAAPVLAGVAAVAAVGEAVHYGLKQFAGKGMGELTMAAASKAAAAEKGQVEVYPDTSGDTYTMQGQKLAPQPMNPFDQKVASATHEVLREGEFSVEEAKADIRYRMEEQMRNYSWAKGKVNDLFGQNMMDITDAVGDKRVEMAMEATAPDRKPALKGLNVGMTGASAPAPCGMA